MTQGSRKFVLAGALVILVLGAYIVWGRLTAPALPAGIAKGNGRIEATETDIAALSAGRIAKIAVSEGDSVKFGDVLVRMDTDQLQAQKRQAEAQLRRATIGVETAGSLVKQAEAQLAAATAQIEQAAAVADAAETRLLRSRQLARSNALAQQVLETDLSNERQARAGLESARANKAAAEAGVSSAKAQVIDAEAAVDAAKAAIDSISTLLDDAVLTAPRDGRVQYRVAQEGEIVAAGGRILNMVDLTDVYMTFFLPTSQAGRVAVGGEVRLVMDAAPGVVIPATVSYVADVAQFTPKTVETADEREKLMFRIRARIDPQLLQKYIKFVKTGLPGTAYLKTDSGAEWPADLGNLVQ